MMAMTYRWHGVECQSACPGPHALPYSLSPWCGENAIIMSLYKESLFVIENIWARNWIYLWYVLSHAPCLLSRFCYIPQAVNEVIVYRTWSAFDRHLLHHSVTRNDWCTRLYMRWLHVWVTYCDITPRLSVRPLKKLRLAPPDPSQVTFKIYFKRRLQPTCRA